jgi:four helix bundle protein
MDNDRKSAKRFQDVKVWKKSHELALEVYRITRTFPREEIFALTSQMRRASVSVPANIAEGFKKKGTKDKLNFYNTSQGSLEELKYYFILSKDLGYIASNDLLQAQAEEVSKMLERWCESIRSAHRL